MQSYFPNTAAPLLGRSSWILETCPSAHDIICLPCMCYTTDLPVFHAGVVTCGNSDVGVDKAISVITTLSRSTFVISGVTFAIGTSDIDTTTSVSLFGRTRLNGYTVQSRCQCPLVLSDT